MPSLPPPMLLSLLLLLTAFRDGLTAPDITMSIHGAGWPSTSMVGSGVGGVGGGIGTGGSGTADSQPSFTANQVHTLLSSIEFRLRDLSNTFRRDQQSERVNSRIDMMFNKLSHLEVSNGMWFDKFQQSVMEECGPNHMTRRLDKAQQQLEITLEHIETTLQTVQNHQKELEKEIKKVADRQTELSAEIQSMGRDLSSEFDKHNSSQNAFRKQLQETVTNLSQQPKVPDRSLSTCPCSQNDDPSQFSDTITANKLASTVNNMYTGLKERSDNTHVLLKELVEITDKYRRKLDSDRHEVINEFLDGFLETAIGEIAAIQKKSENELEAKIKENLQLLIDGQNLFMDNCHRLQSNERQIENDMVLILERILDNINNKSTSEGATLEQLTKMLKSQSSREEKMFAELSELGKTQSDQVARTVAFSTNQVMKLHQDVMNISNALMAINFGASDLCNTTTTLTDIDDESHYFNRTINSHNANPLTSNNWNATSSTEKPIAKSPQPMSVEKSKNHKKLMTDDYTV